MKLHDKLNNFSFEWDDNEFRNVITTPVNDCNFTISLNPSYNIILDYFDTVLLNNLISDLLNNNNLGYNTDNTSELKASLVTERYNIIINDTNNEFKILIKDRSSSDIIIHNFKFKEFKSFILLCLSQFNTACKLRDDIISQVKICKTS